MNMSNKQTLQNIWSITDRPLIDIMTKPKRATPVRKFSDSSTDSDSDESRRGSFVAVPKEFRPNIPSNETTKKNKSSKVLQNQKPTIQSTNSAFTEYSSNKLSYPPTESKDFYSEVTHKTSPQPTNVPFGQNTNRPKTTSVKCERVIPPNVTTEVKRHETCSQIRKNSPSSQNITKPYEQVMRPNLTTEAKRNETCSQNRRNMSSGQNNNRPKCTPVKYEQLVSPNLNTEVKRYEKCSQITNNLSSGQNTSRPNKTPVKYERVMSPNSTSEFKKNDTCFQITSSGQNADRHAGKDNSKIVKYTIKSKSQVTSNSLSIKTEVCVSTSTATKSEKQGKGLQYEYVGKEHGTIQYDFNLGQDRKSTSKEGLIYEAKLLTEENHNSHSETRQNNFKEQYHTALQETVVKWDSLLSLHEENYDHQDKVKQTVTYDTNASIPKEKRNTGKKNIKPPNKKFPSSNQTRKHPRGKPNQRKFNNSLEEGNFKQSKQKTAPNQMKSKINHEEKEFGSETTFYKNNFQSDNNSSVKAKISNSNANTENMNEGFKWMCKTSEHDSIHNHGINSNILQRSLQQELCQEFNSKVNNSDQKTEKDAADLKSILQYGKDISDLIIGSHTALSTFIPLYEEWKTLRHELIRHFELLEKNLKESSKSCSRYRDIINMAQTGATIATAIPHPYVSLPAKIISVLTSLFTAFANKSKKDNINEATEITTSLLKEAHASSELYMYGLQCNHQFEETTKLIEEFHSTAEKQKFFAIENREITKFIQGILEYKPTHRIFYKKMHKCFQELMDQGRSLEARRFCEPFTLYTSTALDVIGYLDWRFPQDNFNSESVRHEVEHLHQLIQYSDSASLKDLLQRIQNCIRILNNELTFIERSLKNISLLNTYPKQFN